MSEKPMGKDPRKLSYSQNFLKSPEFVGSLVDRTGINRDDLVVEIGPGKGVITTELAKKAGKVIGVEYDSNLARALKASFSDYTNVEIIEADFLRWQLPREPYKVFANIPFDITADIVNKLLSASNPPEDTYLIMQDRAAERFIGVPVGLNSQISVILQPFFKMEIVARIDRWQFEPVPNMNAVLTRFEKKREPLVDLELIDLYRDFVVYGYNQWQPTILDAFSKVFTKKQLDIMARNFRLGGKKPSELNVDQWIGMFDTFMRYVPRDKKVLVEGAEKRLRAKQARMQKQHRTRKR